MSKRVIRDLSAGRLIKTPMGKRQSLRPIGLERYNIKRSSRLDLFKPRSAKKTKNLIEFLLGNGNRASRATLAKKYTRLRVLTPSGNYAVRLQFNQLNR